MVLVDQKALIRKLKDSREEVSRAGIGIFKDDGSRIGILKPVDERLANDESVIASLASWRGKFMSYFLTQFQVTSERTRGWLANVVQKDDTRVLFLIIDDSGKAVGNFSVCNISGSSAELDNLIRGEKGGDPKLIFYSELCLMAWLYGALGVNDIYLHVFTNNPRTISLHESVGFRKKEVFKMTKKEDSDQVKYVVDRSASPAPGELGLIRMSIDKNEFLSKYKWLEE